MSSKTENVGNDPTIMGNEKPRRNMDDKEGAGAPQPGPGSKPSDQNDRMTKSGRLDPQDLGKSSPSPDKPRTH